MDRNSDSLRMHSFNFNGVFIFTIPFSAHNYLLSSRSSSTPLTSTLASRPTRRLLSYCLRRGSSFYPNGEYFRGGRFRYRDEPGGRELYEDFGQGRRRRWWSDGNSEDGLDEEFDPIQYGDEDGEQLWDKIWILKVFKSYGYLLPFIFASMLLATGPKAFLMALAIPVGQSVISLILDKLWQHPWQEKPKSSSRNKMNPSSNSSKSSADFRNQEQDGNGEEFRGRRVYQSWVAADADLNDAKDGGSKRRSFGGWDDLDLGRTQARRPPSGSEKLRKKGRYGDTPLFLRLLIAFFPFLGSWIRIL